MRKVKRLMAIILCLSLVFCTLGFVSVSASDSAASETDYEPGNPNAIFENFTENSIAKAAIRLSWVNPKASTLEKVEIYGDNTYGANKFDTLIGTVSNPTPGAVSDYVVKSLGSADLVHKNHYTYRLVYVFEDKQTEVYVSSKAVTNYLDRPLRAAADKTRSAVTIAASMDNMPGITQQFVKDADGTYFVKLSANVSATNTSYRYLKFFIGGSNVTKANTKYNVTFKYKSDSDFILGVFDFKKNTSWTDITKEVTTNANGVAIFTADWVSSFYNLCIKSVKIETIPGENETATVVDSYDCSVNNIMPEKVGNITTTLTNNDLSFNIGASDSWWWATGNDGIGHVANYYNIYEVIGGEKFLRARLARNEMSTTNIPVTLHNVSDGSHTYEITCSTESGLESEAKTVSVTVLPYEPKNVTAIRKSGAGTAGINVSWINPVTTTLSKVSIYEVDTATGTETLLSGEGGLDKTPGKTVKYAHDNLTASSAHTYRVQFDYTDHKSVEVYTSAIVATGEMRNMITNANSKQFCIFNSNTTTSNPGTINKVIADGNNHYLDFRSNIADSSESAWIYIMLNSSMEGNTKYTLSFKAKSVAEEKFNVHVGTQSGNQRATDVVIPESDKWTEVTSTISAPWTPDSLFLEFKDTVEGLCIDDVKFYKTSAAKTVLMQQDFEKIGLKSNAAFPEKVGGVLANSSAGAATMTISPSNSWNVQADGFNENIARTAIYYNIYEDVNGIKVLRAKLIRAAFNDSIPNVTLKGLTNGKTYTYYVTCEDDKGVLESEPCTVTVTPQGGLVVSDFALKDAESSTATTIAAGKTYSVSVKVDNSTGRPTGAQMLVAVYNGSELINAYTSTAENVGGSDSKTLEIKNIAIPENAGDKTELKCFVWDNLTSLTPLCDATPYTMAK